MPISISHPIPEWATGDHTREFHQFGVSILKDKIFWLGLLYY